MLYLKKKIEAITGWSHHDKKIKLNTHGESLLVIRPEKAAYNIYLCILISFQVLITNTMTRSFVPPLHIFCAPQF